MHNISDKLTLEEQVNLCEERLGVLSSKIFGSYAFPREVAKIFIRHSAWWKHPKSGWVRAPKHAERVEEGRNGWEITFGANRLFISLAIKRCVIVIRQFISDRDEGDDYSIVELEQILRHQVRCSIGNHNGDIYNSPYNISGNDMLFGTASIDLKDFVGLVISISEIKNLSRY